MRDIHTRTTQSRYKTKQEKIQITTIYSNIRSKLESLQQPTTEQLNDCTENRNNHQWLREKKVEK